MTEFLRNLTILVAMLLLIIYCNIAKESFEQENPDLSGSPIFWLGVSAVILLVVLL